MNYASPLQRLKNPSIVEIPQKILYCDTEVFGE